MEPWYRRVKRWGQTNLTEDDPERNNIDFWRGQWKRTKVQGLIINCGGIVSYYPSKYGLQYRAATLGEKDYYKMWSDAAGEEGLAVIARMDINRATEEFYKAHPDWFCVDKDGQPMMSQGRYMSCVNSGYYKEYIPAVLTEIIERYHPEGFADNSWKGVGRKQICYCENCRKKFRDSYGLPLPEAPDFNDPVYRKWIRWSMDCRTENWDLFNETTKKAGGPDCLWFGMINADPTDTSLVDMKALLDRSEFVFTDHQSRDMLNGFEQNHENGALLHLASREDLIIPESLANYTRGPRTFRLAANPYMETRMWTVSGAAGGISPWYHHIGGGTRDRRQFETPVPFFNWHAENEAFLYDRTSLANVAVAYSTENAVFYGREEVKERVALPWRGVLTALHEARIPFLPLHMDDLLRYQDRFNVLILPDICAMTDAQEEAVLTLIQNGKNVLVTGRTGALDAEGEPRKENRILKALGITLTGKSYGAFVSQPSSWEYPLAHTYLHLTENRHQILRGFEETALIGLGGGVWEAETAGQLQPVCGYVKPFPIYPPEFSWIREIDDNVHPLFAGTLENGAKAVYFAADIDRCAGRDRLPDHFKLLENAVRDLLSEPLPLTLDGEGYIDTAIYRQGERRIVHLTNLSFADVQGYCHRMLPVYDLTLKLPAEGKKKAIVKRLVEKEERELLAVQDEFAIPVKKLEDFEVFVIE